MGAYLTFFRENAAWLCAGALLSFLSIFGQTTFISVFAGEIRAEYGLSHGQWGLVYALGTTASAVAMVWAGGLADRFRMRALGAGVMVWLALAALAMASNQSLLLLPLVILMLRLGGQGMAAHISAVAMARWFVANRGKALAVATFGFALAEAVMTIGMTALKSVVPWRMIWVGSAGFCLLMMPLLWRLLRTERTPQSHAERDSSTGMDGRHWTRAEVLRHPLFWALTPGLVAFPAFGTAFWFQQVHFAEIKGWSHLALVSVFPLGTLVFLVSTALFGWGIDRWGTARLFPLYLLPLVAAFGLHGAAPSVGYTAAGVMLMGLAGGGQATLPAACWAEFFGTRHLGSIKAAVAALMVLGSALGPGLSGVLIDFGIELDIQYLGYAGVFAVCAVVMIPALRTSQARLEATA